MKNKLTKKIPASVKHLSESMASEIEIFFEILSQEANRKLAMQRISTQPSGKN